MEEGNLSKGQKASYTRLLNKIKQEAEELIGGIEKAKSEIDLLHAHLLEDDNEESIRTQIDSFLEIVEEDSQSVKKILEEISVYRDKVLEPDVGLSFEIEASYESINEIAEETRLLRDNFNKSSLLLYGEVEEDGGGLIHDAQALMSEFQASLESNKNKSSELILQIEGALEGATNIELAKAFKDQKESYKWPKNGWAALFIASITAMAYFAYDLNKLTGTGADYLIEVLKRIPLFGPLVWLALFASKQQSQNKRLEQEYAHKETIAKTYIGHRNQIDKLAESSEKEALVTKLATSTIDAIEFNPSSTLENNIHKEELPSSEALKLLKQAIDKIGS